MTDGLRLCARRSWERFTLKPVAGGCQILSHWDTPLAFKSPTDSMIYAGKEPVTAGVPLTVSFVGVAEPTAGLTRFTPQPATKKAAKKRASAGGDGSSTVEQAAAKQPKGSPAVSPVLPAVALPIFSNAHTASKAALAPKVEDDTKKVAAVVGGGMAAAGGGAAGGGAAAAAAAASPVSRQQERQEAARLYANVPPGGRAGSRSVTSVVSKHRLCFCYVPS